MSSLRTKRCETDFFPEDPDYKLIYRLIRKRTKEADWLNRTLVTVCFCCNITADSSISSEAASDYNMVFEDCVDYYHESKLNLHSTMGPRKVMMIFSENWVRDCSLLC